MTYETLLTELDQGVMTLTLNRPDKLNAFNTVMSRELIDFFQRVNAMDENQIGLKRLSEKIGTDGMLDTTVRFKQVPFKQATISIEQVMEVFKISREEAIAKFAKAGIMPAGGFTNVTSEVVPPAQIAAPASEGLKEVQKEAEATEKAAQAAAHQQAQADANKNRRNR